MISPIEFYTKELAKYTLQAETIQMRLRRLSIFRLLVVAISGIAIYFTYSNKPLVLLIIILGAIAFARLVISYVRSTKHKNLTKSLIGLNQEELRISKSEYEHRPDGRLYQDPKHHYAHDIDLFGKGSFFQYMHRTITKEGSDLLASLLMANDPKKIVQKQSAVKELAEKAIWRQTFYARSTLVDVNTPAIQIIDWLKEYTSFVPSFFKWFSNLFSMASLILVSIYILGYIPGSFIGLWLIIGLLITGIYVQKVNALSNQCDQLKSTFRQYGQLLDLIETESFDCPLLQEKQNQIHSNISKASLIFKQFSKHLDALDNRNNLLMALVINGLALSDLRQSFKIEAWIKKYSHKVDDWLQAVSFFEAYNSLGNYCFNHPRFVFPEITSSHKTTNIEQLGHPLLDPIKRIDSDFSIQNQAFFIVTGANMAGKSTFLRTISLHIVMANVGLPVCARKSTYSPVKLVTSMRTTDSLNDDSSYFFAELKRLKFIVDAISSEPYFIVLDEILKGTNSTDKAIGSKKFVEKLVASDATGIIATHDLSLCDIADKLEDVKNYYFDASIIDDELHFDYTLKKGICQNMNASFLLKKMEIV